MPVHKHLYPHPLLFRIHLENMLFFYSRWFTECWWRGFQPIASRQQRFHVTLHNQEHWTEYIYENIPGIQTSETNSNRLAVQTLPTCTQGINRLFIIYCLLLSISTKRSVLEKVNWYFEKNDVSIKYSRGLLLQEGVVFSNWQFAKKFEKLNFEIAIKWQFCFSQRH